MKKILFKVITLVLLLSILSGCSAKNIDNGESLDGSDEDIKIESESDKKTDKKTDKEEDVNMPEKPRKTPIMGWASWNAYHPRISEDIIISQAEKLVEYGLDDLGYVYVNVDDGWQKGRGSDGYVITHPQRFPSGMKSLSDKTGYTFGGWYKEPECINLFDVENEIVPGYKTVINPLKLYAGWEKIEQ